MPAVPLAFREAAAQFTSRGRPLDRDAPVGAVALGLTLAPGLSAGLSCAGQIGACAEDHANRAISLR